MIKKWFPLVVMGVCLIGNMAGAVDYKADAIEKKGNVFYVKETGQPLTGTLIRTYPDGKKMAESVFVNGILNGESHAYYENGTLNHTVEFKNNLKDGTYKQYDEKEILRMEAVFKDDKLNGAFIIYYPSKQIQLREMYQNGVLDGERIEYYENGQIKSKSVYTQNQLNGTMQEYYADGKLLSESTLQSGKYNGVAKTFYPNGKVQYEMHFKNGVLDGDNLRYDENGKVNEKRVYKDGTAISGFTTVNGKETPLTSEQLDELNSKATLHTPENTYKKDGILYDSKTKKVISGIFRVTNKQGVIQEEYEFWNGRPHGAAQIFDAQGRLTQQTFFDKGTKIGYRMMDETGRVLKTCRIEASGKEICQ